MIKILLIFIVMLQSLAYSQASSEYVFTYDKENDFNMADENAVNELSIMVERRGLPLANRLVRFVSLNPDIFLFEIENANDDLLEYSHTNVFVIPTDEDGIAKVNLKPIGVGNGVALMHILYVGSSGNTNISYEEVAYVNVRDNPFQSKLLNVENENLNAKYSVIIIVTLFPALFLTSIALIFISYFRHIYYKYRNIKSKIVIYTFFGFSSIKKKFYPMLSLIFLELAIVGTTVVIGNYMFSIALLVLFIAGFTVKKEKMYAIGFFILACIFVIYLHLNTLVNYLGLEFIVKNDVMSSPIFVLILFFAITSLAGGIYIPVSISILYRVIFGLSDLSLIFALIGIFLSSVFYIVKVKKDIPFLYELDLIKIKD